MVAAMIMAVVLPMLTAALFLLGRHLQRRQALGEQLSLVSRQHIELFQGGQLNELQMEAAKARLRDLLERGEVAAVEASLRPGPQYVVQVRALAEIGTEDAGRILERQLQRRLTDDQMEQSWYWIDLASGLRSINREESLPHLLRCAESAGEVPLGHFFAAETVCFLGFAGYLQQPDSPLGRAALRVLHRALEGLRYGVQPYMIAEARLGEMIEGLWDHRPDAVRPLVVRVLQETVRLVERASHVKAALAEGAEQESFDWQVSRLTVLEPVLSDYLSEAPRYLCASLEGARTQEFCDTLHALNDLRAEAASALLPLLARGGCPHKELAVEVLTWSRDNAELGAQLVARRAHSRRRPSTPADIPYRAILRSLRGHPSPETEALLLQACCDWDPTYRAAAFSSLGWWAPFRQQEALPRLQQGRRDPNPEVRHTARAALARLGERQALQWFRQALTGEESHHVHEAIQFIAHEGLTLLWPDLDRLTDSEDLDVAQHAREAVARLFEEMEHGRG